MNTLGKSVLYLYSQPVQVGKRWMQNRQLVTWLESQYNVKKAFCICPDDSPLIQIDGLSNQLVAQSQFEANPPDILFIEYGLGFDYDEGRDTLISAKVDVKMLERYFNNGGITILDIGSRFLNSRKYNQQVKLVLNQARLPSIRLTRSINDYPSPFGISLETAADNVIYAIDPQSNVGEDIDILVLITPDYVSKIADPSLRNIYNGVKKISFCMPLVLDGVNNTPLLIGNQTTQLLAADVFVDCTIPVFAALNDKGNGYSVTI